MTPGTRLVVGVGNPLAGDDGFGGAVIDRLRQRGDRPESVDLVNAHTDLLGQIDTFAAYDEIVLVDAVIGAGASGGVAVFDEWTFSNWPDTSPGSHQMSPLAAVKLFRVLHPHAATRIMLVALSTDRVMIGPGVPDAAVAAGVEMVVRLWGPDEVTRLHQLP